MKSKSLIFIFVLIFMIAISFSAVSANDAQNNISGEVSGDVDFVTVNPGNTSGELTYNIPAEAKDIKSANVYVNVYSGSAQNTYGANANISLKTVNGENQIASEGLWIESGSTDGTIYPVNDHTTKCYSDYQMYYDITDSVKGLNGSAITLKVDTFKMEDKQFDGRIKLIALVLAYDDGDNDSINYWVDSVQKWSKTNVTTTFATSDVCNILGADLYNIVLSSTDGTYKLNDEFLGDADEHKSGGFYYQYNYWDVTDKLSEIEDTELLAIAGTGAYGSSIKEVLTLLKVKNIEADLSFTTEYTSVPCIYAGTNNTVTIKANSNKAGKYIIQLFADSVLVNSTEVDIDGETTVLLTDPTIRPIDETTVNGANNTQVLYEVVMDYENMTVIAVNKTLPVLFNGNLGYDFEYDITGFDPTCYINYITGDLVVSIKDESSYLAAKDMNRTDVWTVNLDDNSEIADAFLFIPYNWFNAKSYVEAADMFNLTFNNQVILPVAYYRDQSNLGNYGKYGYGVLIYDVGSLINPNGNNTLVLNKKYATPAVYPSTLVYMYDTFGGSAKQVSMTWGADLLSSDNNIAKRPVISNTMIDVTSTDFVSANLYVLAASAQKGEGNIIINDEVFNDVWSGTSKTTDLFTLDVTDILNNSNNISFVSTGSTILALPQMIVVDSGVVMSVDSIATEYANTAYAGTNNTLTVTVSTDRAGKYNFALFADYVMVNQMEVNLTNGTNTVLLTDPTIRPIDETTVNGANNSRVIYSVGMAYNGNVAHNDIVVPLLYNGNLGYDYEYDVPGFSYLTDSFITGDIVIDIKEDSTYLAAGDMNRTDVWTVNLTDGSEIVDGYLFIPYNWFNPNLANETEDMFDITFNGEVIEPYSYYRDQSNLGKYGGYGYGVLIYDVGYLMNTTGDNTLVLNKKYATPAVYPTIFVYMYDVPGGTIKEVSIVEGVDLLANTSNVAGRPVKSDSKIYLSNDDVDVATLYVLAAGAQKGEGNIVINGVLYEDVWSGSTKSSDLYAVDISDDLNSDNNVSFVATGSTILALPQIIVTDTNVSLSIDSVKTEYTSVPCIYAGTNNTFTVTVSSNNDVQATLSVFVGNVAVDSIDVNLTAGSNTLTLTDPTIRPVDETTVNGADNNIADYRFRLEYNSYVIYNEFSYPVLYNGYLGYDYEYDVPEFLPLSGVTVTGGVVVDVKDEGTYLAAGVMNRTDVWTINLTDDSEIVEGYLFIPYNWFNPNLANETEDMFDVTFNGEVIEPIAYSRDQGNLGKYGGYGYGVLIYYVGELINTSGDNTLVLNKKYATPAVYPSVLVYMYDVPGGTIKEVSIVYGADLLSNDYNVAGRTVQSDSQIGIDNCDDVELATLYVLAAGAQKGEGNLIVNDELYENVWNGSSKSTDLYAIDITDSLDNLNDISFVATGSTILALPQIIVTESGLAVGIDSVKTEYTSVPCVYAATNNTFTVTVSSSRDAQVILDLRADGLTVDLVLVNLTNGTNTILLTDPTIRPADENTVNGADNPIVEYGIELYYNGFSDYEYLELPLLYNGNLGKDLEYNATYIEDKNVFVVDGGIAIETQDVSTYLSAGATNRTDGWEILFENSTIEKAFIYVAYNWDKTGVNGPVFNTTFNGKVITPKSAYRDQSNLGNYGKYGYGLFIYDVTDLVQEGNNTFVLNKESGLTAVYPSSMIVLYNDTESDYVYTIYMADGTDLLSNANNNAGRTVKTDNYVVVDEYKTVNSTLYVFAASAQKGEGNIIFNGLEYADVWNGTSNTFDTYELDITENIYYINKISFVATGSTILALNQIIVTQTMKEKLPTKFADITIEGNLNVTLKLVDDLGNAIANATITYTMGDVNGTVLTDDNGEFTIQGENGKTLDINYAGAVPYLPTSISIKFKDVVPSLVESHFNIPGGVITLNGYAVDTKAGEEGMSYATELLDSEGKPISGVKIQFAVNDKIYNRTTDEKGSFTPYKLNMVRAGRYTMAFYFAGNENYTSAFGSVCVDLDKKPITIKASAISYKASVKTKSFTATLSTKACSSADGKAHLSSGKKVTLTVNGKTYSGKTNSKGQVTFKLTNLSKKGTYTAKIAFAGDNTYESATKSVKITVK